MGKITILKTFRDATANERMRQRSKYPEIINGLRAIDFGWKDQLLAIEYEVDDNDLFSRIRENPAWALDFFGVIAEIRQSSLSANIVTPDRIAAFERQPKFRSVAHIVRVTFRTVESLRYETRIQAQTLAHPKGRLQYKFTAK